MTRKDLHNLLIEDYILHLVVGENIPEDAPEEFHIIKLYIHDKNWNWNLYSNLALPYLINHSEFLDIKEDPRYFFKEEYDPETQGCKYHCEIKPLEKLKGVYRILNGERFKIMDIDPLCNLETKKVPTRKKQKNN